FVVFVSYRLPPRLPSFPTRRSSDLRRAVSEPEDSLRAGGGEFRFLLAQAWLEAPAGPHRAAVPAAHSAGTGPRRLHDRTRDPHRDGECEAGGGYTAGIRPALSGCYPGSLRILPIACRSASRAASSSAIERPPASSSTPSISAALVASSKLGDPSDAQRRTWLGPRCSR